VKSYLVLGRGEVYTGFWWGNLKETDRLVDTEVDGRIILRWTFRSGMWVTDWIDLVQGRGRWRALVNTVMKLQVQ
jgi:hypothetical protein